MITIRQYAPGEAIIRENEPGESAFFIERGKVEVTREMEGRRIHLAFMEAGAAFGEMSLVDEVPHSATVTAVEETLVREIHRENIRAEMKEHPDVIILFLKNIFERLREANLKLANHRSAPPAEAAAVPPADAAPAGKPSLYSIEPMTPKAAEAMSDNPFRFSAFPIRIGRKSNDPLVNNQLEITDQDPLQISRHHVSIIRENGKIGVMDRGSQLGALVDGVRMGGKKNPPGPVFFKGEEGILVLGTDDSPYRYRIKPAP